MLGGAEAFDVGLRGCFGGWNKSTVVVVGAGRFWNSGSGTADSRSPKAGRVHCDLVGDLLGGMTKGLYNHSRGASTRSRRCKGPDISSLCLKTWMLSIIAGKKRKQRLVAGLVQWSVIGQPPPCVLLGFVPLVCL